MATYYTSDTHFNQQRTFDLSMREMYFSTLEESTYWMIEHWNEMVTEQDTVYHLGDFGDYEVAKQLNGKIILQYGNYERKDPPTELQQSYFHGIHKDLGLVNDGMILVHEPENRVKYTKDNNLPVMFYLFGHIHEKQKVKRNGLNVGVDVHNFTPVSAEVLEFYKTAIQKVYDDNCFVNY